VARADNRWVTCAAEVAATTLARHAADVDRGGRWPAEGLAALGEAGLLGLTVPTASGGAGEKPRTFAAVTCLLAEECASTAMIYLMHTCAMQVIAAAPSFPRRDQTLHAAAAGRHLSTLAFSEKGSRSHFWAPVSQAVAEGDCYRLSAEKSWVTSAGRADSYVVSTRSAGRAEPTTSTLFFVPSGAPGLSVSGPWDGLGLRGNASAPLRLDGLRLAAADRLSAEGDGLAAMLTTVLPWFQLGSAAVAVGLARAATKATRRHLLGARLEHLGQTLADLPGPRTTLARMQLLTAVHEAFVDHVAGRLEVPGPDTLLAVLESKAAAAEAALQVTDLAMRACGGAAFSRHLPVERCFRDARAGAVMAPTTEVLHDLIGRSLLGLPLL
jgi:alkylation response protein AidB-like acyl-CoA dehydrogenase